MSEHALTEAKILEAAVAVLRRHGPSKTTVVDVAEALGVSHGSIYRFFPSKQALREAVVRQWLESTARRLAPHSQSQEAPRQALLAWFEALRGLKKAQVCEEPELFEAYRVLTGEARSVLVAYKQELFAQIGGLVARGVAAGDFAAVDPLSTAQALWSATLMFHHPAFAKGWDEPERDREFDQIWQLLMNGLCPEAARHKESK